MPAARAAAPTAASVGVCDSTDRTLAVTGRTSKMPVLPRYPVPPHCPHPRPRIGVAPTRSASVSPSKVSTRALGVYGPTQSAHGRRTSRCATTRLSDDAIRKGWMPMSTSRVSAATASLVCSVVSTRWPVIEAWRASSAVSESRTSPTSTTSGSCRRMDRSPLLKDRPARSFVCTCVMPGSWISTGSSRVTTFLSVVAMWESTE